MPAATAKARARGGRQAILKAAAALFARKGFRGTTISDIAAAARVNRALVSYHFGNKAGLYGVLLGEAVAEAGATLDLQSFESSVPNSEKRLIHAFAKVYEAHPHLAPMLVREHLDPDFLLDSENAEKLGGFIALTRNVLKGIELRAEARRYDPQIVHLICVGALIYFLITDPYRQRMRGALSPPPAHPTIWEFADVLADFLTRALRD